VGLLSAGTLLLLLACGGGDAAKSAATADSAEPAARGATHAHEGSGEHSHEGTGAHTHATADTLASGVSLAPGTGRDWTASATVLSVGDSVRVLVSVEGSDARARHRVELLAGDCQEPGSELATLTPVATGSSGAGSSQTTLPRSRTAGHAHGALRVRAGDGAPAACAAVHLGAEHSHE
jgi:hypothetical protein